MIRWKDRASRMLHCDGKTVHLTMYEADLLDKLISRPGLTNSTERLVDYIYEGEDEPKDARKVIHILICRIRKKGVPIKTDSVGRGYSNYFVSPEDVGFLPGMRYTIKGCEGEFRVKQVMTVPVVEFESTALGTRVMKPVDDPVFGKLERVL